jgi:hypothetical protein
MVLSAFLETAMKEKMFRASETYGNSTQTCSILACHSSNQLKEYDSCAFSGMILLTLLPPNEMAKW